MNILLHSIYSFTFCEQVHKRTVCRKGLLTAKTGYITSNSYGLGDYAFGTILEITKGIQKAAIFGTQMSEALESTVNSAANKWCDFNQVVALTVPPFFLSCKILLD